jgi:hypothetical protein
MTAIGAGAGSRSALGGRTTAAADATAAAETTGDDSEGLGWADEYRDSATWQVPPPCDRSGEHCIKQHLFYDRDPGYDKTTRPVYNDTTTTVLYVGMSLYHILDTVSPPPALHILAASAPNPIILCIINAFNIHFEKLAKGSTT